MDDSDSRMPARRQRPADGDEWSCGAFYAGSFSGRRRWLGDGQLDYKSRATGIVFYVNGAAMPATMRAAIASPKPVRDLWVEN